MHWPPRIPFVLSASGVLCAGILAATLTTADPRWWLSCFSRLGAMNDVSSTFFNGGLVLTGAVIALSARPVLIGLRATPSAGFRARRTVPMLIVALGLSLILIGVLPLSFNVFAHERAANAALASSAGLLLMHRLHLRGLSRTLDRIANAAVMILAVGMAALIAGAITLTVFEAFAFGSVITWLHALEVVAKRFRLASATPFTADSQPLPLSPIWGTR